MNHYNAMHMRAAPSPRDPNPNCTAELDYMRRGFWDDVGWTLYHCPACHVVIAAVGGGAHWWNYIVTNPDIVDEAERAALAERVVVGPGGPTVPDHANGAAVPGLADGGERRRDGGQ